MGEPIEFLNHALKWERGFVSAVGIANYKIEREIGIPVWRIDQDVRRPALAQPKPLRFAVLVKCGVSRNGTDHSEQAGGLIVWNNADEDGDWRVHFPNGEWGYFAPSELTPI